MIHIRRKIALSVCCGILAVSNWLSAGDTAITSVSTSAGFFNPTIGQKLSIKIETSEAGNLSAKILDRDGYITRTLASEQQTKAGTTVLQWDGRNEKKEVVPDEAYSIHVILKTKDSTSVYFPANHPLKSVHAEIKYYDRKNGILSYSLPVPARVHIQAGWAVKGADGSRDNGPVLKTIANREPRVGGSIIEQWMGYDDSGTIYVPASQDFAMDIAATALPENSVIAIGNGSIKFVDYSVRRTGISLFSFHEAFAKGHAGLVSYQDVSPKINCKPSKAEWSKVQTAWIVKKNRLIVAGALDGASAEYFAQQPGELDVFVDTKLIKHVDKPTSPFRFEFPLNPSAASGVHVLAVNWGSDYGPAAVGAFRFEREPDKKKNESAKLSAASK